MSVITQSFALADGRFVEVLLAGNPVGFPLVMHHGTPADATTFADWHEPCQARGIRLICASRPGSQRRHAWLAAQWHTLLVTCRPSWIGWARPNS
jgi:hypothetical protein